MQTIQHMCYFPTKYVVYINRLSPTGPVTLHSWPKRPVFRGNDLALEYVQL